MMSTRQSDQHRGGDRLTLREVRVRAGWSRQRLAMIAGVSDTTVRLFEISPQSVRDPARREKLTQVYSDLYALAAGPARG